MNSWWIDPIRKYCSIAYLLEARWTSNCSWCSEMPLPAYKAYFARGISDSWRALSIYLPFYFLISRNFLKAYRESLTLTSGIDPDMQFPLCFLIFLLRQVFFMGFLTLICFAIWALFSILELFLLMAKLPFAFCLLIVLRPFVFLSLMALAYSLDFRTSTLLTEPWLTKFWFSFVSS